MSRPFAMLVALAFPFVACSQTNPGADAGADSGASVLGFTPSNIASAIAGVDTTKLVDIDVTANGDSPKLECGIQPGGGCVALTVTEPDGTQIDVYFARSWHIEQKVVSPAADAKPIAIVALTTIDIAGRLDGSAQNTTADGGGFTGTTTSGSGKGGGAVGQSTNGTSGIGGGGGAFCGAGGAGGNASGAFGTGGAKYGNAQLVPLVPGSAGGGAATFGGASGGAIQLVAGTSITVEPSGVISVGGGGGDPGGAPSAGQAGGGGGSGGALLLEAPNVSIAGTLEANGGGGGGGGPGSVYGADATLNAQPAAGGTTGTPGAGGNGGAGASAAGTAGGPGDATTGGSNTAGGGGGGAGYIRINTTSGSATISGTLSPDATTTCATQGQLAH